MSPKDAGAGTHSAAESPSFSVAMKELESILERIDSDGIDIDQLATELRRATELLELCRDKIRKADVGIASQVGAAGLQVLVYGYGKTGLDCQIEIGVLIPITQDQGLGVAAHSVRDRLGQRARTVVQQD